jgi:hypothetical protein
MLVTDEVTHDDKFWLKFVARVNMFDISCTFDTSQDDKSWLNDPASLNISVMVVAFDTFHKGISSLNTGLLGTRCLKSLAQGIHPICYNGPSISRGNLFHVFRSTPIVVPATGLIIPGVSFCSILEFFI